MTVHESECVRGCVYLSVEKVKSQKSTYLGHWKSVHPLLIIFFHCWVASKQINKHVSLENAF